MVTLNGFAQIDLTSNLKVCMPFNGNANDLSGNLNNGAVSGTTLTTDRFGNPNKAYQFSNVNNSHIAISSFSAIAPTNELTISMWAKVDQITSNCLFTLDPDNMNDRCVGCAQYLDGSSTMMVWDYGDITNQGRVVVQGIAQDMNSWHHYVFVVSQSGNLKKTFLDGVMNSNGSYSSTCTNKNLPFFIGGSFSNGSSGKIMWNGKIDDVSIYNRALTNAEVAALYSGANICQEVTTSLNELRAFENLSVFPTVSSTGYYQVSSSKFGDGSFLEVFSADGKRLSIREMRENSTVDLSEVNPGIYLLKFYSKDGVYVKRVIRQ